MYLQRWHGWCHMKQQPSRRKFCVHHTIMHHVTPSEQHTVRNTQRSLILRRTGCTRGLGDCCDRSATSSPRKRRCSVLPFDFSTCVCSCRVRVKERYGIFRLGRHNRILFAQPTMTVIIIRAIQAWVLIQWRSSCGQFLPLCVFWV